MTRETADALLSTLMAYIHADALHTFGNAHYTTHVVDSYREGALYALMNLLPDPVPSPS